jgi:tol-pal system protein YbgF
MHQVEGVSVDRPHEAFMKKLIICALAALLIHPALVPPASAANREHQLMMADIRMLQEQAQQLAVTLAALNDVLKTMNTRIDQQTEAMRKALADQKLIVDNMGTDLRVIRERVDDTNVRIATLGQEVEALRTSIPTTAAPAPTATPETTDPNAVPPTPAPAAPSTAGLSPTRMYDTAFGDYAAGQWSLAISGFEQFLKVFPKSEMADEAQFYIGETYYASGKYQDAITAYNQVIQNYASSNSTPLAYYKRGLAQDRLGQTEAARGSWEYLVKTYPDSDASRLAKQNLDRLGKKPEHM